MSILVTGGTGFIGSGLVRKLVERGEKDIVIFDVAPNLKRIADIKDKVKIIQGDLTIWPEVMNAIKDNKVEGIFHLGSMLSGACEANPWAGYQTVVTGTMHILEAARLFDVKRILFSSTSATYSIGIPKVITEQTLQRPVSFYGAGKLFCENLGRFYRRKFGIDFRCLRFFAVLGPGTKNQPRYGEHLTMMIENPALGKPYICQVREYQGMPQTYVKDCVRGLDMLYYAPSERIKTICYNIIGVSPMKTAKELQLAVKKVIPEAKLSFKLDPELAKFFDAMVGGMQAVDDSPAREEWGWQPLYSDFEKIVEDFVNEIRTRPALWGME